jgi:TatA/E family protein of Tat protein translocase
MPNIGPVELVIILVIALLILGPGKLPDVGAALGKSIREFRKASSDVQEAVQVDTSPLPATTPEAAAEAQAQAAAPAPAPAPAPAVAPHAADLPGAPAAPVAPAPAGAAAPSEPTPNTN